MPYYEMVNPSIKHKKDSSTGITINSMRSSTWKRYGDQWKVIFHQGTNVA